MSIVIFTSLIFVILNKLLINQQLMGLMVAISYLPCSYIVYFLYLWGTDKMNKIVMQHHTFDLLFNS